MLREQWCEACKRVTNGDCGGHGPNVFAANVRLISFTTPTQPCHHGSRCVQCQLDKLPKASDVDIDGKGE